MSESTTPKGLKPTLGLWALIIYGVGDILGAGIYAVVGKVAALAGYATWLSFLIAMAVAMLTALSYAELGGRFPKSGGASYFCQAAFRRKDIPLIIGWLVLCSGIASMATGSHACFGYLQRALPAAADWPAAPFLIGFLCFLGVINFSGMKFSSIANLFCTTLELAGLGIVVAAGLYFVYGNAGPVVDPAPMTDVDMVASLKAVLMGSTLAFFSFIGFEDLVNVSEEVKNPTRNVPIAIIASLAIASVIYLIVVVVSLQVVPPSEVRELGNKPLLFEVVDRGMPVMPGWVFSMIAIFAISNSALLNYIMGSRLLYGMAHQKLLPSWLGKVHASRRTPVVAIGVVLAIAIVLALSGSLEKLAGTTSLLLLSVFTIVHISLILVKLRQSGQEHQGFRIPMFVPVIGIVTSLGLMGFSGIEALKTYGWILGIGIVFVVINYFVGRKDEIDFSELG